MPGGVLLVGPAACGAQVLAIVLGAFGDDAAPAFGPNGFAATEARLEIRPVDVAPFPLPATLPLVLGGLAILAILAGLARRRRA